MSDGADVLNGDAAANTLSGEGGGDTIRGGSGNDVLYGYGQQDLFPNSGQITATRIATGFSGPLFAAAPPGDPNRLFVVEKNTGAIKIFDLASNTVTATFLDLPQNDFSSNSERGLLGLAFHPDYQSNGRVFVYVTRPDGDIELREYTRASANAADPASGRVLLRIEHSEYANHNGGWIGFGPDGLLYLAVGDGGGAGDPLGSGQNLDSLLGKMLRIDVDGDDFAADPDRNYAIPDDNPFVGVAGADEIYAYGLRNPFRSSFDTATGDLYIADVGQGRREEIDFIAAGSAGGHNFGWRVREGDIGYPNPAAANPGGFAEPIAVYAHDTPEGGQSVTGGYVNRGPGGLQGAYIFGDFVSGNLFSLKVENGIVVDYSVRTDQVVVTAGTLNQIASFAVDGAGRQYVIGLDGEIHRLDFSANAADGADTLYGGDGLDSVWGGAGDDRLFGEAGADILYGGIGDDRLDGGGSRDVMVGGAGDDTYVVNVSTEELYEQSGYDTVLSSVAFTLPTGVEALVLSAAVRGTGNGLDNRLTGSAGADQLLGLAGADTLVGGAGRDVLTGGAGADSFVFGVAAHSVIATSRSDVIVDFSRTEGDRINLAGIDAIAATGADDAFIFIGGAGFTGGASGALRAFYNAAAQLVVVQGETTGDGVADFQILLPSASNLGLTAADFVL